MGLLRSNSRSHASNRKQSFKKKVNSKNKTSAKNITDSKPSKVDQPIIENNQLPPDTARPLEAPNENTLGESKLNEAIMAMTDTAAVSKAIDNSEASEIRPKEIINCLETPLKAEQVFQKLDLKKGQDCSNLFVNLGSQKLESASEYKNLQDMMADVLPHEAYRPTIRADFTFGDPALAKDNSVGVLGGVGCKADAEFMCKFESHIKDGESGTVSLLSIPPPRESSEIFGGERLNIFKYFSRVADFKKEGKFKDYVIAGNTGYVNKAPLQLATAVVGTGSLTDMPKAYAEKTLKELPSKIKEVKSHAKKLNPNYVEKKGLKPEITIFGTTLAKKKQLYGKTYSALNRSIDKKIDAELKKFKNEESKKGHHLSKKEELEKRAEIESDPKFQKISWDELSDDEQVESQNLINGEKDGSGTKAERDAYVKKIIQKHKEKEAQGIEMVIGMNCTEFSGMIGEDGFKMLSDAGVLVVNSQESFSEILADRFSGVHKTEPKPLEKVDDFNKDRLSISKMGPKDSKKQDSILLGHFNNNKSKITQSRRISMTL